jgi:hypothetical protein
MVISVGPRTRAMKRFSLSFSGSWAELIMNKQAALLWNRDAPQLCHLRQITHWPDPRTQFEGHYEFHIGDLFSTQCHFSCDQSGERWAINSQIVLKAEFSITLCNFCIVRHYPNWCLRLMLWLMPIRDSDVPFQDLDANSLSVTDLTRQPSTCPLASQ